MNEVVFRRNWPYLALLSLWRKLEAQADPYAEHVLWVASKYRNGRVGK